MLIRSENSEYIARDIGDRYSGVPLFQKLKGMGVPETVAVYPNTKWRMVFDVMNYYSDLPDENKGLKMLSKIIELAVHPLNFSNSNMGESDKLIADFNKRLAFDKLCIKEIDGDFRLVRLTKTPEVKTSTDYITDVISYFKDEYNKVRLSGLSYEYELGTNIESLLFMYDADEVYRNIDETNGKTKAIEQLAKIGFIKEYSIEQRSKGKSKMYPYYFCQNKKCPLKGLSIRKKDLEDKFNLLLQEMTTDDDVIELAKAVFIDAKENDEKNRAVEDAVREQRKKECEEEIDTYAGLAAKTKIPSVIEQYEKKIEKLADELAELEATKTIEYNYGIPYRTALDKTLGILKNPYSTWVKLDVYQQQKFFVFLFEENLSYDRNEGYRTPKYTILTRILSQIADGNTDFVDLTSHSSNI